MSTERLPINEMTLRQLRRVASECGVSRYSRMRKDQLLAAIQAIQAMQQQDAVRERAAQEVVEIAKFNLGQDDSTVVALASVDEGLPDLPQGYGDSRIVLMPRDPQWAYTYWDISFAAKQELRQQGGQQLALRIYDVTDVSLMFQSPHSIQEYPCDELAQEWYLPIPVSDRDYVIDIGYRCADGRWLILSRSAPVRIPPIYPSDWIEDHFLTVSWEEELQGKTYPILLPPGKQTTIAPSVSAYQPTYGLTEVDQAERVAGSIFGSMQQAQVPGSVQHVAGSIQQSVSSYVLASGSGLWAVPGAVTQSGVGMSGVGMNMSGVGITTSGVGMNMSGVGITTSGVGMNMSGVGMNMSGVGMSGVGMSGVGMSGVGFSGSLPIVRPRQFWLIADAELIVYGATEPDATVTVGGRPIALNPDGTFRFQMSFQDGLIDYPIMAVAADSEQMRAIHMKFERETPERRTNTKEEAVEEWIS